MHAPPLAQLEPSIITSLPGPRAAELIARDERATSSSYTRVYPLVVDRARGAMMQDVDGNRFLDFTAGIAVCSTGHCHPRVVEAITEQASRLLHMSGTDFYYEVQGTLANRLAALLPNGENNRVFFTNSGAEAVEAAIKLARYHTKRTQMIAFFGGFHGRTLGALSLTGSKVIQRAGFGPLVPGVHHIEYPSCYRCVRRTADASLCCGKSLEQLEQLFARTVAPTEVAAVVVEPIQGEGGYVVPPAHFLRDLRDITRQHGILLIADEVQSGMGRTGKMLAMEHFGVTPDIVCLAKGIASGLPLGAIVASQQVMNWPPGSHASTFGGNPLSCAAALATLDLLEESLLQNATDVGEYLRAKLSELASEFAIIGDVRGIGLMIGMQLVENRESRLPIPKVRDAVVQGAFQRGLLLLGCGDSTIRFSPPLVITRRQVDIAIEILRDVLLHL
ncbi:Acetylornithine transaminase [Pirellula staleyi DSM 6068]|uniref:Acetylornithine transaminase n=1 Tax=Pirellula staleyi (strain ATCC 27377 / DSM 6068 / ICPB 4128) TaxID=530564 RepID=D2QZP5_PIRSD|nr:acetyl ornithine aminotransferase family protein [Pirellula staleyi]ADB16528.1 Acetylornithine transaminase [Pirellula staleyi DSM 6068]